MNKWRKTTWLLGVVVVTCAAIVMFSYTNKHATTQRAHQPTIAVSLDFYGEIARAVGGKHANVSTAISSADVDPHDYEPTPSIARKYAQADIIISNGAGYDQWSSAFAKQNAKATAITMAQLTHYKSGTNEHLWYQPGSAAKLVRALTKTLSRMNPAAKKYYQQRSRAYLQKLQRLTQLQEQAQVKLHGVQYLATEPVYDNTLQTLGAVSALPDFANAVEEENDPTASDIQKWHSLIEQKRVQFVVNNTQNSSRVVKQAVAYAKAHALPVVNVTETQPEHTSYIDWQCATLQATLSAIKSK